MFINTNVMCVVTCPDPNKADGVGLVDLGNYFTAPDGNRCLITTPEYARKYHKLVDVPIYVTKYNAEVTGGGAKE